MCFKHRCSEPDNERQFDRSGKLNGQGYTDMWNFIDKMIKFMDQPQHCGNVASDVKDLQRPKLKEKKNWVHGQSNQNRRFGPNVNSQISNRFDRRENFERQDGPRSQARGNLKHCNTAIIIWGSHKLPVFVH